MATKKVFFVIGTRPEAIKLYPIIKDMENIDNINVCVCITGQQRQLLDKIKAELGIKADYDLDVMTPGQPLASLTSKLIAAISQTIELESPDLVMVQGDTASALCGAWSGFYAQVPVAHVEAGLRTHEKYSPFPEEINRQMISRIATIHFCPTKNNQANLLAEGIKENIYITGNTGLDTIARISKQTATKADSKPYIIYTVHRRENRLHLKTLAQQIIRLTTELTSYEHIYIQHPNPSTSLKKVLISTESPRVIPPLDYKNMVHTLKQAALVITDSGGLIEECSFLGIPSIILRTSTERQESLAEESSIICSPALDNLYSMATDLLSNDEQITKMSLPSTAFGDGRSSSRVVELILSYFNQR